MEQRQHFTQKLEELKVKVLRMAALSETAVHKATKAFLENDADLAQEVVDEDQILNDLETDLDTFNMEMLALDQPLAIDLRTIIGAMRITMNLERIGDQAVNLAHRALFLSARPPLPHNEKLEQLCSVSKNMLSEALKAYIDEDVPLAMRVCAMDDRADELTIRILKDFIAEMVDETRIVERGVHGIIGARHLERIADGATNIAETIAFIVDGTNLKHRHE